MNECFFPDTNQVEEQPKPTFNTFIFNDLRTWLDWAAHRRQKPRNGLAVSGVSGLVVAVSRSAGSGIRGDQAGVQLEVARLVGPHPRQQRREGLRFGGREL
jgi:hypothetical protein